MTAGFHELLKFYIGNVIRTSPCNPIDIHDNFDIIYNSINEVCHVVRGTHRQFSFNPVQRSPL